MLNILPKELDDLQDHTEAMQKQYGGGGRLVGVAWTIRDQEVVNELLASIGTEHKGYMPAMTNLASWPHPSMGCWSIVSMIHQARRRILAELKP